MCNTYINTKEVSKIPLSRNQFTIVDIDDYDWLMLFKWYAAPAWREGEYYANNKSIHGSTPIKMHRLIMDAPKGMEVDHINGDPLDNRRCNLRIVTASQNQMNRRKKRGARSKYLGVYYDEKYKKWYVRMCSKGQRIRLGAFKSELDAVLAYNETVQRINGEYARLNPIDELLLKERRGDK